MFGKGTAGWMFALRSFCCGGIAVSAVRNMACSVSLRVAACIAVAAVLAVVSAVAASLNKTGSRRGFPASVVLCSMSPQPTKLQLRPWLPLWPSPVKRPP